MILNIIVSNHILYCNLFVFSELLTYCIFTCEIQHARTSDLLQMLLCVCMLKTRQTLTVHAVLCVGQSC